MYGLFITFLLRYLGHHSSMPSPLAPDPIRVQPCVWCLFWTKKLHSGNIIQLEINPYIGAIIVNGNIYWNYSKPGLVKSAIKVSWTDLKAKGLEILGIDRD